MGLFGWLFGSAAPGGRPSGTRRYDYPTGNIELAIRVNRGEPLAVVLDEIGAKWKPGHEHLWDEYDIESLVDTAEKQFHVVNCLLYGRVSIYRALRTRGADVRGQDPFDHRGDVPEEVARLGARFPRLYPGAFEGRLPPMQMNAVDLPDRDGEMEAYLRARKESR